MNNNKVVEAVERIINNAVEQDLSTSVSIDSPVDAFLCNTARRLINAKKAYTKDSCGYADLMVSLRNFLLAFQTSMTVTQIDISDDNPYGIYRDDTTGAVYAAPDIPKFIKHPSFVNDAFVNSGTENPVMKSKYLLNTNAYIESITGYKQFKSLEQKLCVYGGLNTPAGYTSLISMPTGGGKSLVTQALAYEKPGLTIVVVPTISLAIDQERVAKEAIKVAKDNEIFCYYSGIKNFTDIKTSIREKTAKLLFISPEALIKNNEFRSLIAEANQRKYLRNIVIDEAHIVVAWGDLFRVDYQCLSPWRRELLKVTPEIRTFLLSATFQDKTVKNLKRLFSDGENWLEIRCDSLRKEPRFIFQKATSYADKSSKVLELVNKLPRPMIIYVNAPYQAKKWKSFLEDNGYGNVHTFTGETKTSERNELIRQWSNDEYSLMVATSAFGVGVDKPDVRTVLHLYVPESPDSYYQELGRGGRDRLSCLSVMCVTDEDINVAYKHLGKVLTPEKLWGRWWSMYSNPDNQWQNGEIAIIASTKPQYNRISSFEEGNDVDEKWNINVLLLLSRYELLDIVGLDLDQSNRYIITIRIRNDKIVENKKQGTELINEIREKEAEKTSKAFSLMRKAIEKNDSLCWSEMFYETYPLVSEYCAGCNAHDMVEEDELNRFPLLDSVAGPEKEVSSATLEFFSNTNEALIITADEYNGIVTKYCPDVVVCDNNIKFDNADNRTMIIMNFAEFKELQARDDGFYISGLIMPMYDQADDIARIIQKVLNNYKYVIHVSNRDFCVSTSSGKLLSDVVSGTVIR